MDAIVVSVGCEEKEICGLNQNTTCINVIEALLKEKQTRSGFDSELSKEVRRFSGLTTELLKEGVKQYVIVEDYQGDEKALPPETRILLVWQAWGNEQRHVKFSLKKDKNAKSNCSFADGQNSFACPMNCNQRHQFESNHFLQNLTPDQKKRIRRNILQHKRAIIHQRTRVNIDNNNNNHQGTHAGVEDFKKRTQRESEARTPVHHDFTSNNTKVTVTLSEEQFIDGIITGPDCALPNEIKSKFIKSALEKNLGKEHCTYRRPYHRRKPNFYEDSDDLSDRNSSLSPLRSRGLHHYPYCSKSRRRSNSRRGSHGHKRHGRVSKHSKRRRSSRGSHNSTDSTNSTPCTASEGASDGDADDEKSIMTNFGMLLSRQNVATFPSNAQSLVGHNKDTKTATSNVTATDFSATGTSCSETSNTSSSSLSATSSSDTSTSGAELYNEAFFAKRAAAQAAAAEAEAVRKSKNVLKLFKIAKPAQSLISSYKRKKKSAPSNIPLVQEGSVKPTDKSIRVKNSDYGRSKAQFESTKTNEAIRKSSITDEKTISNKQNPSKSFAAEKKTATAGNDSNDDGALTSSLEQMRNFVLAQQQRLDEMHMRSCFSNKEIVEIEEQFHKWRAQTLGRNYVQDTYLAGTDETGASIDRVNSRLDDASISSGYLHACNDKTLLENFVQTCEKIVGVQMRIEECKRQVEILSQEVRDEEWKRSHDPRMTSKTRSMVNHALGSVEQEHGKSWNDDDHTATKSSPEMGRKSRSSGEGLSTANSDFDSCSLELERTRIELEADINLNLRLSSETNEVEALMDKSRQLLQKKGENMLDLVRQLAQSPEGIPPDLWEEYGELLAAYDAEVAQQRQRYWSERAQVDNDKRTQAQKISVVDLENPEKPQNTPSTPQDDPESEPPLSSTSALHHALSPSDCYEQSNQERSVPIAIGKHYPSHCHPATTGNRPIVDKKPRFQKSLSFPLLPMRPISAYNDSDYDDVTVTGSALSNRGCMAPQVKADACRRGSVDLLPCSAQRNSQHNNSKNGDDSGNVSAGSTSSDSPLPPSTNIEDSTRSSPLFLQDRLRCKNTYSQFSHSLKYADQNQKKSEKIYTKKPPIPVKSPAARMVGTWLTEMKTGLPSNSASKLARRNSSLEFETAPLVGQRSFARRATSFGKGQIKLTAFPPATEVCTKRVEIHGQHLAQAQRKESALRFNNAESRGRDTCTSFNLPPPNKVSLANLHSVRSNLFNKNQNPVISGADFLNKSNGYIRGSTSTYENDSDTGLSSMYSADSFDRLNATAGETLV